MATDHLSPIQRETWDNNVIVVRDGAVANDATWDGKVRNLIYDTGTMTWIAQTSGGGGGGDASAANQLTEIGHLADIEAALEGFFNAPATADAVVLTYTDATKANLSTAVFKIGGVSGTTLMTITAGYPSATVETFVRS